MPQPAEIAPDVAPRLFMGDLDDSNDVARLQELGIGFVLSLCPERLGEAPYWDLPTRLAEAGIVQLIYPARDADDFDIVADVLARGALDFVEQALPPSGPGILVHCWAGVNRSGAIVVAFLALRRGMTIAAAMRRATATRGTVLTNRAFLLALVQEGRRLARETSRKREAHTSPEAP